MKKTLLLLTFSAIALTACNKKACYRCATNYGALTESTEFDICDKTKSEIRKLKKEWSEPKNFTDQQGNPIVPYAECDKIE